MRFALTLIFFGLGLLSAWSQNIQDLLDLLNREIEQSPVYVAQKESTITALKENLRKTHTLQDSLKLYNSIFNEYKSFQYDSAYVYASTYLNLAQKVQDAETLLTARKNLLFCYFSGGANNEAIDLIQSTSTRQVSPQQRGIYYALCTRFYSEMSNISQDPLYRKLYWENVKFYRDSVLALLPDTAYLYQEIKTLYHTGPSNASQRISDFQQLLKITPDYHRRAIVASNLANVYLNEKDTLHAIQYLVESAVSDLRAAVMETSSKTDLARCLYLKGYIQEANRYVHIALSEANFYSAYNRIININSVLPFIEKAYNEQVGRNRLVLIGILTVISFLLLCSIAAFLIIYRQKKKLRYASEIISKNRDTLQELHQIKDAYILEAIRAKSDYIDKTEHVFKKIEFCQNTRQYRELDRILADFNLKEERNNLFQSFDRTFLMLFPHFIEQYNQLFGPADRVVTDGHTLTPELRIYALIRLGITKNDEIAKFLKLSVNTIYTYKTKAKAKTIVPKDHFEEYVLQISQDTD